MGNARVRLRANKGLKLAFADQPTANQRNWKQPLLITVVFSAGLGLGLLRQGADSNPDYGAVSAPPEVPTDGSNAPEPYVPEPGAVEAPPSGTASRESLPAAQPPQQTGTAIIPRVRRFQAAFAEPRQHSSEILLAYPEAVIRPDAEQEDNPVLPNPLPSGLDDLTAEPGVEVFEVPAPSGSDTSELVAADRADNQSPTHPDLPLAGRSSVDLLPAPEQTSSPLTQAELAIIADAARAHDPVAAAEDEPVSGEVSPRIEPVQPTEGGGISSGLARPETSVADEAVSGATGPSALEDSNEDGAAPATGSDPFAVNENHKGLTLAPADGARRSITAHAAGLVERPSETAPEKPIPSGAYAIPFQIQGSTVATIPIHFDSQDRMSVRLSDILDLIKSRMEPAEFARLHASSNAKEYIEIRDLISFGLSLTMNEEGTWFVLGLK